MLTLCKREINSLERKIYYTFAKVLGKVIII